MFFQSVQKAMVWVAEPHKHMPVSQIKWDLYVQLNMQIIQKIFLLHNNTYSVTVHVLFKVIVLGKNCCLSCISRKGVMFLRYKESLLRVPK